MARKMQAKYDPELEAEARSFISEITGTEVPSGSLFLDALKDGKVLCQLVNTLSPGIVKKINKMNMPFMQMENIASFLSAATTLGVRASDTFQVVDLFEAKNPFQVVLTIVALKHAIRGFNDASAHKSSSAWAPVYADVEDEDDEPASAPAPTSDTAGLAAFRAKPASRSRPAGPPPIPKMRAKTHTEAHIRKQSQDERELRAAAEAAHSAAVDEHEYHEAELRKTEDEIARLAVSGVATDQMGGATVQYDHTVKDERAAFTHYKREGEEVTEGLDATVRKKLAAKYDDALEADARDFIEHYTGVTIAPGPESLCKALHDGTVLCTLANALSPGVVKKVNKMKMPFMQMENIASFLNACTSLGVNSSSTFQVVDLFEAKNPGQVVLCLLELARIAGS